MGEQNYGIDVNVARTVAEELKAVNELGVEVAVVVGGGNIFRGVSKSAGNMDRSSADYIGMLATVMNGVVLQDALEKLAVNTRVLSAIDIPQLAESIRRHGMLTAILVDRRSDVSHASMADDAAQARAERPTRVLIGWNGLIPTSGSKERRPSNS